MKFLNDFEYSHKKVLVRVDFNVPLKNGQIQDDTRIKECLPTLNFLLEKNCALILCSHLGRPKGKVVQDMSLRPIAERLKVILGKNILFADDCNGDKTKEIAKNLKPKDILLLENLRFHSEEEKNEKEFSKELASLADCYVNDAFGSSHRIHSSVVGVTNYLPKFAGFLLEKEIKNLTQIRDNPVSPFVIILGGAKVSDKIKVIKILLKKANSILIGGGMSFTFLRAKGYLIGKSILEEKLIEDSKNVLEEAYKKGVKILLPKDIIVANSLEDNNVSLVLANQIPVNKIGLDIGPKTREEFAEEIQQAKTIFWNGPLGVFEKDIFSKGTKEVVEAIANSSAYKVCGGGDTISAINKFSQKDSFDCISTGGGASLEFLEGKVLPGVAALSKDNYKIII